MSEQELHDKTHQLVSEVIDAIAENEEFREALKSDPEQAMEQFGYAAKVDELISDVEDDQEVTGFANISPRINGLRLIDVRNGTIVASNTSPPTPTCNVRLSPGQFGR